MWCIGSAQGRPPSGRNARSVHLLAMRLCWCQSRQGGRWLGTCSLTVLLLRERVTAPRRKAPPLATAGHANLTARAGTLGDTAMHLTAPCGATRHTMYMVVPD